MLLHVGERAEKAFFFAAPQRDANGAARLDVQCGEDAHRFEHHRGADAVVRGAGGVVPGIVMSAEHDDFFFFPGTDKKEEVVMLGGHYDSWHDATGATDNGIGSAMMLEAVRILAALHVQPRRTIRIALWSGEEEGLLGSLAYVQQHFGSFENQKPEYPKFDAYVNIDSGTGKPRGAGVFGPPPAAEMVDAVMKRFADWGFMGTPPSDSRRTGGTDSTSFNNAGLPGIGLAQDPFDYGSFTLHTNLDPYERIYEEDVREGAVEIAAAVYALAMADQPVPRFKNADMPKPVPEPVPGSPATQVRHVPAK